MDREFGLHTRILIWMTVLLVMLALTAVAVADAPDRSPVASIQAAALDPDSQHTPPAPESR